MRSLPRIFLLVLLFPALMRPSRAQEITRLTHDGRTKTDLFIAPAGDQLLYTSQEHGDLMCLMRLKTAGGEVERIHGSATTSEIAPSVSADGKRLAYVRNDGNLHVQLVIENLATGESVSHNPGSGFAGIRYAHLMPDASRLLVAFPETGGQQLFSISADFKDRQPLTDGQSLDLAPRPSPDGRRIAFASAREGNFDIFVAGIDGKNALQVTEHESLDTHPAWSPDGKRLAFVSLRDGNYELYSMQADGSDVRRLTSTPEREDFPVWAADGRSLYCLADRRGKCDVYRVTPP